MHVHVRTARRSPGDTGPALAAVATRGPPPIPEFPWSLARSPLPCCVLSRYSRRSRMLLESPGLLTGEWWLGAPPLHPPPLRRLKAPCGLGWVPARCSGLAGLTFGAASSTDLPTLQRLALGLAQSSQAPFGRAHSPPESMPQDFQLDTKAVCWLGTPSARPTHRL